VSVVVAEEEVTIEKIKEKILRAIEGLDLKHSFVSGKTNEIMELFENLPLKNLIVITEEIFDNVSEEKLRESYKE